jgi:homoserine O-acetyltransferase
VRRFDAVSYLRLTEAMNRFDRSATLREAPPQQPTLVVSIDSDQLYFPSEQQRVAAVLPRGELLTLDSLYGHDGFLVESHRLVGPLMGLLGTAPMHCTRPVGGRMRLCG